MTFSTLQVVEGVIADCRRALWFEREGVLAVADLHLGYAWAHRHGGQLMPLGAPDDTVERLEQLQRDYRPRRIVLLGDIVHRAVPVAALKDELREMIRRLSPHSEIVFVRGNHDRQLETLMAERTVLESAAGRHVLVHGDTEAARPPDGLLVMGHEHPAVWLDDRVASAAKFPCFLVGGSIVVLPAFSNWAAGSVVGRHEFISPMARAAKFTHAIAVVGSKLLRVPLGA